MKLWKKILIGAAIFYTGTIAGCIYKSIDWSSHPSSGKQFIREDVSSEMLRSFGAPFARPSSAVNVSVAALGNGAGDVVRYAGLQMPVEEANLLVKRLQEHGLIERSDPYYSRTYLDQVEPALAERLWPNKNRNDVEYYEVKKDSSDKSKYMYSVARLAFDPNTGDVFVSSF